MRSLARQIYPPGQSTEFLKTLHAETQAQFMYMLIDCHPETPEEYRLRTRIFPDEGGTEMFHWTGTTPPEHAAELV